MKRELEQKYRVKGFTCESARLSMELIICKVQYRVPIPNDTS